MSALESDREPESQKSLRQRFLKIGTADASDALDALGYLDQGLAAEFRPLTGDSKLAGWAHTILGERASYPVAAGDPRKLEACSAVGRGSISIWSGGDAQAICFFGELIAIGMKERGCVGALVDGGVRDSDWLGHHQFPVFARYRTPVQSIGRWRVVDHGCPLTLPGATTKHVRIDPGDLILADADGALAIPNDVAAEVLEQAERLVAREERIRARLAAGSSLTEALTEHGQL